ncbi:PUA-like domain-containing protein [Mycena pura]|uniref:PUA-like domain-containing protein n=1 Tax=Mycena pura TaxID=153505 RepID=A0AAD6Y0W5_9AGAR|nr:PUA-like domain-containing protein [Mycena pura]
MNLNALLSCMLRPLRSATTLPCGHTVCLSHQSVSCPLEECLPQSSIRPRIPLTSQVQYLPPPGIIAVPVDARRSDVTISEIVALLEGGLQDPFDANADGGNHSESVCELTASQSSSISLPEQQGLVKDDLESDVDDTEPMSSDQQHDTASTPALQTGLLAILCCSLCFQLLYNPVTTPCQHTFCAKCLLRSLDHSQTCPVCRDTLPSFSFFENHAVNRILEALLLAAFPEMYAERGEAIAAAERDSHLDTPIFPCMLVFPGRSANFRIFEPRYRLMLRRCLEQEVPAFGMILPGPSDAGADSAQYGSMLEIRAVTILPDGRSLIETYATHRFRILERGTLDGYAVARIERIDDVPESPALGRTEPSLADLREICTAFVEHLRAKSVWIVEYLLGVHGQPPADAAAFSFWIALVLPIDEYEKARLLPIRSPRRRLQLVVEWIVQLEG